MQSFLSSAIQLAAFSWFAIDTPARADEFSAVEHQRQTILSLAAEAWVHELGRCLDDARWPLDGQLHSGDGEEKVSGIVYE